MTNKHTVKQEQREEPPTGAVGSNQQDFHDRLMQRSNIVGDAGVLGVKFLGAVGRPIVRVSGAILSEMWSLFRAGVDGVRGKVHKHTS